MINRIAQTTFRTSRRQVLAILISGLSLNLGFGRVADRKQAFGQPEARRPFPQRPAYPDGSIRPNHRSQEQLDDDVCVAYDRWRANYLVEENGGARVAFGKPGTEDHAATVSEGQGYGMVIVAHLAGHDPDAQSLFDGLWKFAREHPSDLDGRLMGWRFPADPGGNDSAFDGDADIAYGLLLADAQWGSNGEIDYRMAAKSVLEGTLESTIGPESRLPMLGDWVEPDGSIYNQYTPRTSDFMAGHFRAFGRLTGDQVWEDVASACLSAVYDLQRNWSPKTGLLPDFVEPVSETDHTLRPADPDFLEGPADGQFSYNAGRTPWRLGVDALLNNDVDSLAQLRVMSNWIHEAANGDPHAIRAGYALDGQPLPDSDYFTSFFASPFGVAAMTIPDQQQWLNDIYEAVRESTEGYFEDTVTLLCMLAMTGTFWDPSLD